MNNLLSYCGLVDARISASEKDVPVPRTLILDPVTYMLNNNVWNKIINLNNSV